MYLKVHCKQCPTLCSPRLKPLLTGLHYFQDFNLTKFTINTNIECFPTKYFFVRLENLFIFLSSSITTTPNACVNCSETVSLM